MHEVIVENLLKKYGKEAPPAVNNVSFSVKKGELFGLIGPDGAGKTSIFRMLTTLLLPDGGSGSVNGFDIVKDYKKIRERVGYMPGKFSLYQDLSVEENLNFFATLFGTTVEANYDLVKDIYSQIEPFKKRRAGKLSGGMKQKLALCCALIHRPTVLFLDEPTTGVDTVSRKEFWTMLKRLKNQGITILVSTPYMDEATLCERIALMQDGQILSIDTPTNIIQQFPEKLFAFKASRMSQLLRDLRKNARVKSVFSFGEFHHVAFHDSRQKTVESVANNLKIIGHSNVKYHPIEATIEDCFIQLMSEDREE